jgi:hypothetical protein
VGGIEVGRQTQDHRVVEDLLKSSTFWFVILVLASVVGPCALAVPPRTRRQWLYIAITLALLAWLLPLMASMRSR